MALAWHLIFGAYGFWLPNDPRGSWSDFVGRWELVRFGKATKVDVPWSLAAVEHDRRLRGETKQALKFPPVEFSGRQALAAQAQVLLGPPEAPADGADDGGPENESTARVPPVDGPTRALPAPDGESQAEGG
ncbi:MAG: hypothetical protein IMZ55_10790 [Acidobacteria bacterium]|nr:hypothetical protein [Planctomycetota bacterium]MBE3133953.1 hypothetical protein [Acidobacteriota bacterium]